MKRILSIALLLSAVQVQASDNGSNTSRYEEPVQVLPVPVAFEIPKARPGSPTLSLTQGQLTQLLTAAANQGAQQAVEQVKRELEPTRSSQTTALFEKVQKIGLDAGKAGLTEALGAPSTEQATLIASTVVDFLSGNVNIADGVQAALAAQQLTSKLYETMKDEEARRKAGRACLGACMGKASTDIAQAAATASTPSTRTATVAVAGVRETIAPANTPATATPPTTRSGRIQGAQTAAKLSKKEQRQKEIATAAALEALELSRTTKV